MRHKPHILLINPWITDFAAYNFWIKPLGLLYIASLLRENGDPVLTAANWYQTTFYPTPIDLKLNSSEEVLRIGGEKIVCLHTPGHTPGSISIYIDKDGKRVLFAQDLHGPLLKEFGSHLDDWDQSTKKLLDLDADILCEGHFGIYTTKKEVREYILSYRRQYGVG